MRITTELPPNTEGNGVCNRLVDNTWTYRHSHLCLNKFFLCSLSCYCSCSHYSAPFLTFTRHCGSFAVVFNSNPASFIISWDRRIILWNVTPIFPVPCCFQCSRLHSTTRGKTYFYISLVRLFTFPMTTTVWALFNPFFSQCCIC